MRRFPQVVPSLDVVVVSMGQTVGQSQTLGECDYDEGYSITLVWNAVQDALQPSSPAADRTGDDPVQAPPPPQPSSPPPAPPPAPREPAIAHVGQQSLGEADGVPGSCFLYWYVVQVQCSATRVPLSVSRALAVVELRWVTA